MFKTVLTLFSSNLLTQKYILLIKLLVSGPKALVYIYMYKKYLLLNLVILVRKFIISSNFKMLLYFIKSNGSFRLDNSFIL